MISFARRHWRRLRCPHFYEELGCGASPLRTEWGCVRGCGKRRELWVNEIPFSVILPQETVVNDKLVTRSLWPSVR